MVMPAARDHRPALARAWLLLPLLLLGWGLGAFGLLNNVEGMYAEISREMLLSGDWRHWVIPHLNGLPYIEKPPLLYWCQAASFALFGVSDVAARLVPVAATVACMAAMAWYGRRMLAAGGACWGAFVFGSSAGCVFLSKIGMTDPLLSTCLTSALLVSHVAWRHRRADLLRLAMGCLALAVLTKGFVALALYLLVWGSFSLMAARRQWRELLRFHGRLDAIGVFLLVAAPWHLLAALSLEGFSWFYFINEHVLRFLGLREPKDYYSGTPLYYLPRLFLLGMPWTLLLLTGWHWRRRPAMPGPEEDTTAFLWAAVIAPLVFFSVSAAKANYYVLVCLPALSLLVADRLGKGGTGLADWLARAPNRTATLAALLLIPLMGWGVSEAARGEGGFSARLLAAEIRQRDATLPLFLYQDYEDYSALPFYLARSPLGIVEPRSQDLAFALKRWRDPLLYPSLAEFLARPGAAWVVVLDARVRDGLPADLAAQLMPVARQGNATLYRRGP